MEEVNLFIIISLLISVILVDLYAYRGIKPILNKFKRSFLRKSLQFIYGSVTVLIIIGISLFFYSVRDQQNSDSYVHFGYLVNAFALFYIPKFVLIVFVLLKDIQIAIIWLTKLMTSRNRNREPELKTKRKIKRSEFLYQLGLLLASIPFLSILYGTTKGKYDFYVTNQKLSFPNLPKAFKNLKILQISDLHLGSFNKNYEQIEVAVEMINDQKADIVLFTGDMVNNFADETEGWDSVLKKIKAPMGKYSILGNHDYGDDTEWISPELKEANLQGIKDFHKRIGFQLLLNENKRLRIDDDEIALIGVENWGEPPFTQYGKLELAMKNTDELPFKILMSHDPNHWDKEVLQTNIDLTLSGHTHGMQFGIESAGIKWSPVQYVYPRWGGLYKEDKQYLYVNRGLGFIAFSGRVGMPPEITLIELS